MTPSIPIGDRRTNLAVLGDPIAHSLSPLIHQYWIAHFGLDAAYNAIKVPRGGLSAALQDLVERNHYRGFNITVPHKQAAMHLCGDIDALALAVGAVNTISVRAGILHGTNTDVFGFMENLHLAHPAYDIHKAPVAVLGAGGAARAVVYALQQAGAPDIRITNRTIERARDLAATLSGASPIQVFSWAERHAMLEGAGLLVNTTSLGMQGQPPLDLYLAKLSPRAIVYDLVYKPQITPLLHNAQKRGNPTVGGLGMLLQQARPAFQSWFGILPDVTEDLRRMVATAITAESMD